MKYEWKKYPEQTPTDSGYYYTYHLMNDERWYKAIWWDSKTSKWIHWRPAENKAKIEPNVIAFVLESRTDYYCPCLTGVTDNLDKYSAYEDDKTET